MPNADKRPLRKVAEYLPSWLLYFVFAYLISPVLILSLRVSARKAGWNHLRIGKLSMYGDTEFIRLCGSSIERIQSLDSNLYQRLTRSNRVYVVYDAQGAGNAAAPVLFAINSAYQAWQTEGIITRLVFVAFCVSDFSLRQTWDKEYPKMYQDALEKSGAWLETHGFPQELVDCYKAP